MYNTFPADLIFDLIFHLNHVNFPFKPFKPCELLMYIEINSFFAYNILCNIYKDCKFIIKKKVIMHNDNCIIHSI